MKILLVEPKKEPREVEIEHTLSAEQAVVGGLIEAVYPWEDPVVLICNDEGKINSLPLNRSLEDYDIIAGTFFICGIDRGDFCSLPPDLLEKYKKKFQYPEVFIQFGDHLRSIQIRPEPRKGDADETENL